MEEDVFRFQVSMRDVVRVEIRKSGQALVKKGRPFFDCNRAGRVLIL